MNNSWEYLVAFVRDNGPNGVDLVPEQGTAQQGMTITEALNGFGALGWELVAVRPGDNDGVSDTVYLKRPRE